MENEIRTFIAAKIPDLALDEIVGFRRSLTDGFKDVRWVKKDNLHITLKFLGNIKKDDTALISKLLDKILEDLSIINVNLTGLGVLPDERRPRVLYTGLEGEIEKLALVEARLNAQLEDFGLGGGKRHFFPHISIGRFKKNRAVKQVEERTRKLSSFVNGFFKIEEIVLYQSILGKKGAKYIPLHVTKLKN